MNTATLGMAKANVEQRGFLDVDVDPTLDLFAEIERLKKRKMQWCLHTTTRNRIYRT